MHVLCVTFNSKLQWGDNILLAIKKSNTALHPLRLCGGNWTTMKAWL